MLELNDFRKRIAKSLDAKLVRLWSLCDTVIEISLQNGGYLKTFLSEISR